MRTTNLFPAMLLASSLILLGGCTTGQSTSPFSPPKESPASLTSSTTSASAERGQAFAQLHCASCHAISSGTSPHPDAPSFADIINKPDLSNETLNPWLRDSHNFPAIMNFEIAADHINDLAAHMLRLKDPKHKPRI